MIGDREAEKIKKKRTIRTSQAIFISYVFTYALDYALDCVLVYEPYCMNLSMLWMCKTYKP